MKTQTQNILRKINYLEVEIEIQKQILHSIPSGNTSEIENVIKKISSIKNDIEVQRQEIHKIDPVEYGRIIKLEHAVASVKKMASEEEFASIEGMDGQNTCHIHLKDSQKIQCLIKAIQKDGTHIIITMDGDVEKYSKDMVEN